LGQPNTFLAYSDHWALRPSEIWEDEVLGNERAAWELLGGSLDPWQQVWKAKVTREHTFLPSSPSGMLREPWMVTVAEYLDGTIKRRYPPARAFATATVIPGLPLHPSIVASHRGRGRSYTTTVVEETVGAFGIHEPLYTQTPCAGAYNTAAFKKAERVGWFGYMFGGATDLGLRNSAPERRGELDNAYAKTHLLSDVWRFESTGGGCGSAPLEPSSLAGA
jgi:hypothetical protein